MNHKPFNREMDIKQDKRHFKQFVKSVVRALSATFEHPRNCITISSGGVPFICLVSENVKAEKEKCISYNLRLTEKKETCSFLRVCNAMNEFGPYVIVIHHKCYSANHECCRSKGMYYFLCRTINHLDLIHFFFRYTRVCRLPNERISDAFKDCTYPLTHVNVHER
jgi:hypothetical protein